MSLSFSPPWQHVLSHAGVLGVKCEREEDGITEAALQALISVVSPNTMVLKLSGVGAINDMQLANTFDIQHWVAPMVESAYAVKKFRQVTQLFFQDHTPTSTPALWINLETETAYLNRTSIIEAAVDQGITGIVMGRTDLSYSLGLDCQAVETTAVMKRVQGFAEDAKAKGLKTAMGGNITALTFNTLQQWDLPLDTVETRHVVCEATAFLNPSTTLIKDIYAFETAWIRYRREVLNEAPHRLTQRENLLAKRQGLPESPLCPLF
jgi:4-hydroxy-2-oxoheptanedioate aldolase